MFSRHHSFHSLNCWAKRGAEVNHVIIKYNILQPTCKSAVKILWRIKHWFVWVLICVCVILQKQVRWQVRWLVRWTIMLQRMERGRLFTFWVRWTGRGTCIVSLESSISYLLNPSSKRSTRLVKVLINWTCDCWCE